SQRNGVVLEQPPSILVGAYTRGGRQLIDEGFEGKVIGTMTRRAQHHGWDRHLEHVIVNLRIWDLVGMLDEALDRKSINHSSFNRRRRHGSKNGWRHKPVMDGSRQPASVQ